MTTMERAMPPEAPNVLDRYQDAVQLWKTSLEAAEAALAVAQAAEYAKKEARYSAVVSVECPFPSCRADVDMPCRHPAEQHRNVTHGLRDDLSGVNGSGPQAFAEFYAREHPRTS